MRYRRPFVEQVLGKKPRRLAPRYPYPEDMLVKRDIFETLVMDGGAFFFTNQHLGAKDTARFVEAFDSGEALAPWAGARRGGPKATDFDWFAVYDPEQGPWAPGQKIEQHVWLHRLYFLLPLAQDYCRTGNRRRARQWRDFFLAWRRRFPAMGSPPPVPNPKATAYIWHDMQVTWRLLVLLHSVFLLGRRDGGKALTPAEWREVYKAIAVHARWTFAEAGHALARMADGNPADRLHIGNHFLQKGVALICAGTLFPEFEGASDWLKVGRRVVRAHARRDLYCDGGSVEAAPSYSHFIAGLHLLAWRALSVNGLPPIPGHAGAIRRQYAFLENTMSPSDRTLQLGDSYALDARRDLSLARRLFPLPPAPRERSRCYAASQFAVLRSAQATVFVDAMPPRCGHSHPAKPNVLVYVGDRPILVDSGCVNYDLSEWREHFCSWSAHNVVTPGAFGRNRQRWRDIALCIEQSAMRSDGGTVRFVCRHVGDRTAFVWRRSVTLAGVRVEVHDRIETPRRDTFTLSWHLAEEAAPSIAVFGADGRPLRGRETRQPAVNESNRVFGARTLLYRQTGCRAEFRTAIVLG